MSFAFALMSNNRRLLSTAATLIGPQLDRPDGQHGWGLGYYHGGQALMRKQPRSRAGGVDFCDHFDDLLSAIVVGHVRAPDGAAALAENTAPFRCGPWLFAGTGGPANYARIASTVLEMIPSHLQRNIEGSTANEQLFHLFLAFLGDSSRIDDQNLSSAVAAEALRTTFLYLETIGAELAEARLSWILTNGDLIVGTCRGDGLHVLRKHGYARAGSNADGNPIDYPDLRLAAVVTGDLSEAHSTGWERCPRGTILTIDREQNLALHPQLPP